MNDSRKLYHVFALSTLCLSALFLILRTAALFFAFDRTPGYHESGILSTLLYIVTVLFIFGTCIYVFTASKAVKKQRIAVSPDLASPHLSITICSILTAAAFAFVGLWESVAGQSADTTAFLRVIGAALAIVYFAIPKKDKTFLLGLGALAYFVAVLVSEYFDWTVPMNSPLKVMQQIASVCAMLYLCAEMMQFVGKDRPLRLTVCAALAAFFGLANGASLLLAFFVGKIVRTDYAIHAIPALAVGAYALIRLLHCRETSLPAPATNAEAEQNAPTPEETEHPDIPQDLPTTNDEEN